MELDAYSGRGRHAAALLAAAAAVAAIGCALPAGATVYKCQIGTGSVVYQEEPCPKGRELRNFDVDPPDLSVIPAVVAPAPGTASAAAAPSVEKRKELPLFDRDRTAGKASGDAKERKFLHTGMTEAEVLAKVGRPDATSGGSKGHQARWSYLPTDDDPDTVTSLTFAGGVVSDVSRKVIRK
jgi:outer membrane protein assembly factor BamE (lipoprotein component of BamABCDE complex)